MEFTHTTSLCEKKGKVFKNFYYRKMSSKIVLIQCAFALVYNAETFAGNYWIINKGVNYVSVNNIMET